MEKSKIDIPLIVQEKMMRFPLFEENNLSKVGDDIFYTDADLETHTDPTEEGKDSIFCILLNEGNKFFFYEGEAHGLSVGKIVRFDGRIPHAAIGEKGRLAAIIWDVPISYPTEDLIEELKQRVEELKKYNK